MRLNDGSGGLDAIAGNDSLFASVGCSEVSADRGTGDVSCSGALPSKSNLMRFRESASNVPVDRRARTKLVSEPGGLVDTGRALWPGELVVEGRWAATLFIPAAELSSGRSRAPLVVVGPAVPGRASVENGQPEDRGGCTAAQLDDGREVLGDIQGVSTGDESFDEHSPPKMPRRS
jgi:hypothetical protein